jgi:hypothetical protein
MNKQALLKVALGKTAGDHGTLIVVPGAVTASPIPFPPRTDCPRYAHLYYLPQAVLLVRDPTVKAVQASRTLNKRVLLLADWIRPTKLIKTTPLTPLYLGT